MRICPKCQKHRRALQTVYKDKKTKKRWLVTYCGSCHFNFDIEDAPKGSTAQEEIDKPWVSKWFKPL